MRTLIQRVQHASVTIDGQLKSKIGKGLLVLVGIEDRDTQEDIEWLCKKIANLRIFDDENGVMNRSVVETEGEVQTGTFGADMKVELVNDGPVTIWIDSQNKE